MRALKKAALRLSLATASLGVLNTASADIFPVFDCQGVIGDERWCERYSFFERQVDGTPLLTFLRKKSVFAPLSHGNEVVALINVPNPVLMFVAEDPRPNDAEKIEFEKLRMLRANQGRPLPELDRDFEHADVTFGAALDSGLGQITIDDILSPDPQRDTSLAVFGDTDFEPRDGYIFGSWDLAPLGEQLFTRLFLNERPVSGEWLTWTVTFHTPQGEIPYTAWIDCLVPNRATSQANSSSPTVGMFDRFSKQSSSKMLRFDTCGKQ